MSVGNFSYDGFFVKAHTPDVQRALTELINSEDKSRPSRRTVTKYQEALSIPGTTGHKKY